MSRLRGRAVQTSVPRLQVESGALSFFHPLFALAQRMNLLYSDRLGTSSHNQHCQYGGTVAHVSCDGYEWFQHERMLLRPPTHAIGYYALAFTYFFRKEMSSFRAAVEQAVTLNRMDGSVIGLLGLLVHHAGEVERGTQMVEAAMQLNPHYSPVFRVPAFLNAYAQGKYAEALDLSARINMPGFFHAHAVRAAALGQLGQREAAHSALQELLALRPDFAITVRRDYTKWWDSKRVEHLIDGLRKAGLEIADEPSSPFAKPATRA